MADPIVDEKNLISLTELPVTEETLKHFQAAAALTLMDIYDRKVTREQFVEMASPCFALYGSVSKLWMLNNIESVYATGDLHPLAFERARAQVADLVRKQNEVIRETVMRLMECPTSKDPIH